jgi:hypothetical protein
MEFFRFFSTAESAFLSWYQSPLSLLQMALLIAAVCFLVVYAFQAVALYTIAQKGGYDKKWMAFVPFLNTYYIGVLSNKNRLFNLPAKTIGLIAAILEGVYAVLSIIFFVALFTLAANNYLGIDYTSVYYGGETLSIPSALVSYNVPAELYWADWIVYYFDGIILPIFDLAYALCEIMLVVVFFQTYACGHYLLFSIFAVIFPIKGILFFAVRNNKGYNYRDYLRARQARQYEMYRQYHNQGGNPYNYNPYSGRTQPPPDGNPYNSGNNTNHAKPSDPFEDFGSNGNSSNGSSGGDDPFGDL